MGLTANFVSPPKEVFPEVALNAKSNPPKKLPTDETMGSKVSENIPLRDDIGLPKDNGLSLVVASSAENTRPPLLHISNTSGPKGKSQAKNKGLMTPGSLRIFMELRRQSTEKILARCFAILAHIMICRGFDDPLVWVRLDRAIASAEWMLKFPYVHLHHLAKFSSNHKPIWLCSDDVHSQFYRPKRPSHFEEM
ncbi:hypothetical protein SO802_026449 [Lithocarpus litseifolius]|uniref:Uncharacterized protein n=1 Tax=Lithocarpus litseifolius TaxID=425828 RepID=A0AAW2BZS2_9ROSI